MDRLHVACGWVVVWCVMVLPLLADPLTLQQGVSGYSGCSDSFIGNRGFGGEDDPRCGDSPTVILETENYSPS